jgi:quercetin dioxygenase-like cupin family protein
MTAQTFDPNRNSFAFCVDRIQDAVRKAGMEFQETGMKHGGRVVTSRDEQVAQLTTELAVDNVPSGFRKWQLPFFLGEPTHMFMTVAEPGAETPRHSHDEGRVGIRLIVSGSIVYEGRELTAGDWMVIPAGVPYSFRAGQLGAVMFYCYPC